MWWSDVCKPKPLIVTHQYSSHFHFSNVLQIVGQCCFLDLSMLLQHQAIRCQLWNGESQPAQVMGVFVSSYKFSEILLLPLQVTGYFVRITSAPKHSAVPCRWGQSIGLCYSTLDGSVVGDKAQYFHIVYFAIEVAPIPKTSTHRLEQLLGIAASDDLTTDFRKRTSLEYSWNIRRSSSSYIAYILLK